MKFSKKDLVFSIATGFITGVIAWRILVFLEIGTAYSSFLPYLVIIVPLLWIFGVNLGYFLGNYINFFNQFGRFAAVGFTNAAVDFGILNLLISSSGVSEGSLYSVFKGGSFLIATLHSYFWNKFWVFEAGQNKGAVEFGKFIGVSVGAVLVNVLAASAVVGLIDPAFGLSKEVWANVGAIVGSGTALIFSFLGFRILVFKR
mgnify:CR=1 FL=1